MGPYAIFGLGFFVGAVVGIGLFIFILNHFCRMPDSLEVVQKIYTVNCCECSAVCVRDSATHAKWHRVGYRIDFDIGVEILWGCPECFSMKQSS